MNTNLLLRILSALILIPLVFCIIWYGGFWSLLVLAVLVALAAWEWSYVIEKTKKLHFHQVFFILISVITSMTFAVYLLMENGDEQFNLFSFLIAFFSGLMFLIFNNNKHRVAYILGFIAIILTAICLTYIRFHNEDGRMQLIYLLVVTWSMDSGAYFAGRTFKGPKLAPTISPNKTWSGFIGGVLTAILISIIFVYIVDNHASFIHFVSISFISTLLAIIGHIGDLSESAFKRHFSVKDSSHIIPGHGGILDRLDSLAVSSWVLALILVFMP
ncbi:MAG: phosphatidate cytidylyltransferase [Alphaproteobacteria bacterium]